MSSAPPWRDTAPSPASPSAPWRTPPPRAPYRTRWWKLAGVSVLGLGVLAAVTWAVFWIRPPAPARLVVLSAGYDNTLAVPPNPYGKATVRGLADLAKPGGWLGTRSRLNAASPAPLTRLGLPDLTGSRDKCVMVVLSAHGGRDRDGAFLFPEDAGPDPAARVRVKTIVGQLGKLPAKQQKLLILDATEPPAYADLGLVINDFAAAVEDLNDDIAAVPNLAVFMSTGPDQRSWASPEWGQTSFGHHLQRGLAGAADANRDKRITAGELVDFVRPRVHDWARDNRAALQTPVLLPKGDEGTNRVAAMHLAMTDGPPADEPAPTPFDPPPELEAQWAEYRTLATAYVPPTAYTPHLWRKYEAWVLRHEAAVIAGDADGARNCRAKAADLRRQIEAARRLNISPQTLTIQSAVGGLPWVADVPQTFKLRVEQLAASPATERPALWAKLRDVPDFDPALARIQWCRALVEWAAADPLPRLPTVPSLVPLVTEGMSVRPAEVNFLLMLARHVASTNRTEVIGPTLKQILRLRLDAEETAARLPRTAGTSPPPYPFAEQCPSWQRPQPTAADTARRLAEDRSFANDDGNWQAAQLSAGQARTAYGTVTGEIAPVRLWLSQWHWSAARLPGFEEWVVRGPRGDDIEQPDRVRLSRRDALNQRLAFWGGIDPANRIDREPPGTDSPRRLDAALAEEAAALLTSKPEFDAKATPRAEVVRWWHSADAVLTAPPPDGFKPLARRDLVREFRRASRQLLVVGRSKRETLPEVTDQQAREAVFEAASRRGHSLLARLGVSRGVGELAAVRPGEGARELQFRFDRFAFLADGRQSLAEAGSRCGELLDAVTNLATKSKDADAERWVRIAPAHAAVSDAPINRLRRERVRAYLAEQARRTYLDHWYGEGNAPYYRTAVEQLAADARGLGIAATDDPFKPYLGPNPSFPVLAEAPKRFAVTDEPNPELKVAFKRQPPPGIDGVPVFWATPAFPPAKPEPQIRVPVPTDPKAPLPEFVRVIVPPVGASPTTPVAQKGSVRLTGFFRGRVAPLDVGVDVYRLPDRTAVTGPGLNSVAVAVRADPRVRAKYGFGTGAVAVVLDCSGSLGPIDRKDPADRGLYPEALKALDALLRELPPGTTVCVSVFGERTPGGRSAEETIREVLPPTPLPFDTASVVEQVNREVGTLEPWDQSPIVRAVLKARDRIKDDPAPFKAVVLISDGIDSRYADDPTNTAKRSVKDAIRAEFPPSGVSLSVVALPVPKSEAAEQAAFTEVEKLRPVGKFVPVARVKELAAWLRSGLNPRVRFSLSPLAGAATSADLTAGFDGADNWYEGRLDPGAYTLRVFGAPEFAAPVRIERGGRLLIDLTEDRGKLDAARHWYADTAPGVKSGRPADPWRLSLLQNRSEAGGLRLFTAIEDRATSANAVMPLHVGDVWFEVRPVIPAPGPVAVRWTAAPGYPSPAWSVDIPGWPPFPGTPAAASPAVEAWWSPDRPFPASGTWQVPAGTPLLQTALAKVGDTGLTLETVTVEDRAAGAKSEPRKCLVVRVSYPAGSPMWVRPIGATPTASEVRVYKAANRATCVFWGVDPAAVTGFEVVSLNEVLKRAEEAGHHAKIETAPAPSPTSPRPEPPVDPR